MAEDTKIQWCDHTMNPWRGCTKVHEGCQFCYAEVNYSNKMHGVKWGPNGTRVRLSDAGWREPLKWNRAAEQSGVRARVFCASLADVFEDWRGPILNHKGEQLYMNLIRGRDEDLDIGPRQGGNRVALGMIELRHELFRLIDATPYLDWLLLTKRPENIRRMWPLTSDGSDSGESDELPRNNVWLGTSISLQEHADKQVPELLKCRDLSPVLFLSAEPLLGPIDLRRLNDQGDSHDCLLGEVCSKESGCLVIDDGPSIDWCIVGGESGPKSRRCDAQWIRDLRDQCTAADVPVLIKQLGAVPTDDLRTPNEADFWPSGTPTDGKKQFGDRSRLLLKDAKGGEMEEWPPALRVRQFPEVVRA